MKVYKQGSCQKHISGRNSGGTVDPLDCFDGVNWSVVKVKSEAILKRREFST